MQAIQRTPGQQNLPVPIFAHCILKTLAELLSLRKILRLWRTPQFPSKIRTNKLSWINQGRKLTGKRVVTNRLAAPQRVGKFLSNLTPSLSLAVTATTVHAAWLLHAKLLPIQRISFTDRPCHMQEGRGNCLITETASFPPVILGSNATLALIPPTQS